MILTAATLHRKVGISLTIFIATWGMISELVAAFQCGVEEPWRFFGLGSDCFSMVRLLSQHSRIEGINIGFADESDMLRLTFGAQWVLSIFLQMPHSSCSLSMLS
jgi:hypothetical protein